MGGERGQATVEQVGIVLAVAVLVGLLATDLARRGVGLAVARSLTQAVLRAVHVGGGSGGRGGAAIPEATAHEVARFAEAVDGTIAVDERPTLRDVRLELIERLGAKDGEAA